MSSVPAPRSAYVVRDPATGTVLAGCLTYEEAVEAAHRHAWALANDLEGRLDAQGEGHCGGIEVRVEVTDGATGQRLAAYVAWTTAVKARAERRI
jgi:hypothetical protein